MNVPLVPLVGDAEEFLLDHDCGPFWPVRVTDEARECLANGWIEEFEPGWFRATRVGKLRVRVLRLVRRK